MHTLLSAYLNSYVISKNDETEFETVISNLFRPKNTPTLARPSEECIKSHGETLTVKNLHNGSKIPKSDHFNHSSLRSR